MTSKENNPLDAICKIIIKCHALSFRTPHRMWSVCSFHHYKKYTSMVKQHITCYISSIDLPLINSWVAQERREWIKKQKVKKDLCDFVKASPVKVKWDCGSWLPWRRMLFQANQPMKCALVIIQRAMWLSGCLSAGGDKKHEGKMTREWQHYSISLYSFMSAFMMTAVP